MLVAVLCLHFGPPAFAADRLVLIASTSGSVSTLNSLEIQKLFLGLTVVSNGGDLHPLRNESDEGMRELFFQDIVSMSELTYERRMLALTLQQGRGALPVVSSTAEAIRALLDDPSAVSFAWAGDVEHDARVKILRVLWHK